MMTLITADSRSSTMMPGQCKVSPLDPADLADAEELEQTIEESHGPRWTRRPLGRSRATARGPRDDDDPTVGRAWRPAGRRKARQERP
jgi:hypothetical protein